MITRTVAILGYHKIGEPSSGAEPTWFYIAERVFLGHLRYLRDNGWCLLDFATFLRGLDFPESLSERSALITFDDGCRSIVGVRGLDFPAVMFVPTDFIGKSTEFDAGVEPDEPVCGWDELRELEGAGISIQSHGASHRRFSELNEAAMLDELVRSKAVLERGLNKAVQAFAFPYGDCGSSLAETEKLLRQAGYNAAFLYGGGPLRWPPAQPLLLPRIAMGADTDLHVALQ